MTMKYRFFAGMLALAIHVAGSAQETAPAAGDAGKVIASGVVPDEASRAAILGKLRDLYGAGRVVDRLEVGGVVPPANWSDYMTKLITSNLKQVRNGQLQVNGTRVALKGSVANEALRQQVASNMATALNPTYIVDNGLVAAGGEAQGLLDKTLSNRVVEFESGAATLTPTGRAILDEMAAAIKQIGTSKVQVIGHTDSSGNRPANVALSLARANAVKAYLTDKAIPAETLIPVGAGPDQPLVSNDTVEGRAKNRRIEFKLVSQ